MRQDNLQLPCVQPSTSSYNFQLPHSRHGHGGHGGRGEHGNRIGQDRTGQLYHPGWINLLVVFQNRTEHKQQTQKRICAAGQTSPSKLKSCLTFYAPCIKLVFIFNILIPADFVKLSSDRLFRLPREGTMNTTG